MKINDRKDKLRKIKTHFIVKTVLLFFGFDRTINLIESVNFYKGGYFGTSFSQTGSA